MMLPLKMKITHLIIIFFTILLSVKGQQPELHGTIALARIEDGDTLIIMNLPTVEIFGTMIFESKKAAKRYGRLVYNVRKAYPFARLAGIKLQEYSEILLATEDEKERKKIMKQAEDELMAEYGDDLKDLTFTQGKILLKLVDRETGNTSYDIVQDLRGKFTAFFWQSFARIFGYNLKVHYDPEGEDKDIEEIVRLIETGQL